MMVPDHPVEVIGEGLIIFKVTTIRSSLDNLSITMLKTHYRSAKCQIQIQHGS